MIYELGPGVDYIDHCIGTIAEINLAELAQRELGRLVGENDKRTGSKTYSLGSFVSKNGLLDVAFKKTRRPNTRALTESRDIAYLAARVPELLPKLPYFIGLVTVGQDDRPAGILTEDASKGGRLKVYEEKLDPATIDLIKSRCPDMEFSNYTLLEHSTFSVGGEQRILDLAPSIFGLAGLEHDEDNQLFSAAHRKAAASMGELAIRLRTPSKLAQSIAKLPK